MFLAAVPLKAAFCTWIALMFDSNLLIVLFYRRPGFLEFQTGGFGSSAKCSAITKTTPSMVRTPSLKRLWIFTALVVLVQLFVVQAMAASGALHKELHDHAGEAGHECAVTLMLDGGYAAVAPEITPVIVVAEPPPPLLRWISKLADSTPSHLVGGVLAHAPPRGP
jgi:hypothetical protein